MKLKQTPRSLQMITTLLLLVSLLVVAPRLPAIALAQPLVNPERSSEPLMIAEAATIPPAIVSQLRQDLSKRTGIATNQLRFIEVTAQTWSDGCLGLAKSDEMCTQALVNGWRVVFAHGNKRWAYRTNHDGRIYRLESGTPRSGQQPESPQPIGIKLE